MQHALFRAYQLDPVPDSKILVSYSVYAKTTTLLQWNFTGTFIATGSVVALSLALYTYSRLLIPWPRPYVDLVPDY